MPVTPFRLNGSQAIRKPPPGTNCYHSRQHRLAQCLGLRAVNGIPDLLHDGFPVAGELIGLRKRHRAGELAWSEHPEVNIETCVIAGLSPYSWHDEAESIL